MGPLVVFAAALLEFHLLITVTVEAVETDIATDEVRLTGLVSVGTFNAHLYGGAPAIEERKETLIRTLQDDAERQTPDILCLQEVWRRSYIADIVDAVKNVYPYHSSFEDLSDGPASHPACSVDEIRLYESCLQECPSPPGIVITNCTITKCRSIKAQLSQTCFSCLLLEGRYDTHATTKPDILALCSSSVVSASEYNASYGVLLLSKYPLSYVATKDYFSSQHEPILLPRGYIRAEVDGYTFVCTHLQALLAAIYDGPLQFSSFEEEQAGEIEILLQIAEEINNVVLLGDFNHGPEIPGGQAEAPSNYNLMVSTGMFSATVSQLNCCTYCEDNTLLVNETRTNLIIDHIYLHSSSKSAVVEVNLMFDGVYTTGPPVFHLSDHYGVRAVLDFAKMKEQSCLATNTHCSGQWS